MTIPNPDHLIEQAQWLAETPEAGPPRQVDLRRAVSASYYAVFHMAMAAIADEFVGRARAGTSAYGLFYRSTDHRRLKEVCADLAKTTPPARFLPHLPPGGIDRRIRTFAAVLPELQERRHTADYDPAAKFSIKDTRLVIETAVTAMDTFRSAPRAHRRAFLTLLLFPPRG